MAKRIFVELESICPVEGQDYDEVIFNGFDFFAREFLEVFADGHEIFFFSCRRESVRLEVENYLIDNGIPCDELLLRDNGDYSKANELRVNFVLDKFDGNADVAVDSTLFVCLNNEGGVEAFRDLGFKVIQTDWS